MPHGAPRRGAFSRHGTGSVYAASMKAFPTTASLDTIPTLTSDLIDQIVDDPTHPSTRHASEESATFVLMFFRGDWYKVPADKLTAIAKQAAKAEYPYNRDGTLNGDDAETEAAADS